MKKLILVLSIFLFFSCGDKQLKLDIENGAVFGLVDNDVDYTFKYLKESNSFYVANKIKGYSYLDLTYKVSIDNLKLEGDAYKFQVTAYWICDKNGKRSMVQNPETFDGKIISECAAKKMEYSYTIDKNYNKLTVFLNGELQTTLNRMK